MNINVHELISPTYLEPTFSVNFYKIVRPSSTIADDFTYKIQKTNNVLCWRIQDVQLNKLASESSGIFFDCESYIIQWLFDLKIDKTIIEELLVYYWKGQNAAKGLSPLPPNLGEHCPIERIVQWSEPALFFYAFRRTFTFSGRQDDFDVNAPHLLLVRGELVEEMHLYEVACKTESLRSRATFLLIVPKEKAFLYWHGNGTSLEHRSNVRTTESHDRLRKWQESNWADFFVEAMQEGKENAIFLEALQGSLSDYHRLQTLAEGFSPKLFYLNVITGDFLATSVEYPLRAQGVEAPFPFLQSHLYSAIQPALFLLDNSSEVWLWASARDEACNSEELKLAKKLLEKYVDEKENLILIKYAYANEEPMEFKNIFPFWN